MLLPATTPAHLAQARALFEEYAASLPFSLAYQGIDAELATLPGRYAPPRGRLYLAMLNEQPVGTIALRDISSCAAPNTCEMKRLYIQPHTRGHGLARALCNQIITDARAIGYTSMKLDTSNDMHPAMALYTSLGFRPCAPYNDDPHPDTLWFSLRLV